LFYIGLTIPLNFFQNTQHRKKPADCNGVKTQEIANNHSFTRIKIIPLNGQSQKQCGHHPTGKNCLQNLKIE